MIRIIRDIKIIGGVHNRNYGSPSRPDERAPEDLTPEKLDAMVADLAAVIARYTRMDSHIGVEFVTSSGAKVNS